MSTLSPSLARVGQAPDAQPLFPAWFREEWFLWIVFASWSLLPSTKNPVFEIGHGIRALGAELALIPLCVIYLLPRVVAPCTRGGRGWHLGLPIALIGIMTYGWLSTSWSGISPRETTGMRYTMLVSAASGLFAYAAITSVSDVHGFLRRLAIAVSAVCCLYTAQSFLGLGLRSAEAVHTNDFGMDRVRGPLFESSTGYFLIIPVLAFILGETLANRLRPLYGILCSFSLAIALVGMGSRAAYGIFAVFAASCTFLLKGRQRSAAIAVLTVVGCAGGLLIFSKARTDRLTNGAKDARTLTHEAALSIVTHRSAVDSVTGSGLGSWWPWYAVDSDAGDIYTTGRFIHRTQYGVLLYHPHSTILMMLVELGVPGAMFLLLLLGALLLALRRALLIGQYTLLACGLLVSTISFDFDLFLVRRPTRDVVWWLLVFGLLMLLNRHRLEGRSWRRELT